ncbi:MAG: HD domain-containing protein [Lachnospiraceae bacterium]
MTDVKQLNSRSVTKIIRRALGHVDQRLVNHGERVAYMVLKMMEAQGKYSKREIRNACFLAMVHDVGAYKTEEINQMFDFETKKVWGHAIYGYLFIKHLSPFPQMAPVILFHHFSYEKLKKLSVPYQRITQLLSVADRMDTYRGKLTPTTWEGELDSEVIEIFMDTSQKAHFREQIQSGRYLGELDEAIREVPFTQREVDLFLEMMVFAIDFRSYITVVHTMSTTSIAVQLAERMGCTQEELYQMKYGALLHDLGKVGIPIEILESPGRLNNRDMAIMKTHVDMTEEILGHEIDEVIIQIALRHHEKLDGTGYPKGLREAQLTEKEKILAVADMVSALTGRRSYKEAFGKEKTLGIIQTEAREGHLFPEAVEMMTTHYEEIMDRAEVECEPILELYEVIQEEYDTLMKTCKKL